ncbi:MAG: glycosyl transferase, partial [Sneathiella sp.]
WLVPVGDADAIAAALTAAIGMTTDQREAVAAQARHHVTKNFSIEKMCSATLDVYADLAAADK